MVYLEMARDEIHGGGTWSFSNCVWAPSKTRKGRAWPFWSKVLKIKQGDVIIHLRGVRPNANFVGHSMASGNGFETTCRPPHSGEWDYAESFYRANLENFIPFHPPVNLVDIFAERKSELEEYFDRNKARKTDKTNLFYVKQAGRLQCLNGAYLSDIDDELLTILFGDNTPTTALDGIVTSLFVETGSRNATIQSRVGQSSFAEKIRSLYSNRCCFPDCAISDPRFLVASHIARWADNEELRGNLGNGLCFCLLHDKAFEVGLFTLDNQFRVFVNPKERSAESPFLRKLISHHGEQITLAQIRPLGGALLEHWDRVNIEPQVNVDLLTNRT